MTSRSGVLSGARPRWLTRPTWASSAGQEAVELADSAGLVLDPWQAEILDVALAERSDGKWAAPRVALVCPRQNGKGAVLEALELAGLFLFEERVIMHSAHLFKTAAEAYLRIRQLIESTPDLDSRVKRMPSGHGNELIELKNGNRLMFVARSTGGGRGFSGDRIILDEAYDLSTREMSALIPTMAAKSANGNPQVWFTSSAPLPEERSQFLRELCKEGREGSPGLCYIEYAADSEDDLDDEGTWAKANPGFGVRITAEFISSMERASLSSVDFARERCGVWDEDDGDTVIPLHLWVAGEDQSSGPVGPVGFALDVAPDRQSASFAVAGRSGKGGTHIELVERQPGTAWVVTRAKELHERWGTPIAIAQGSPAWSLEPELIEAGVELLPISVEEHSQACGALFDLAMEGGLRHLGQPELTAALQGAKQRYYGDAWLWSRRNSLVDISPIVASTLAAWAFKCLAERDPALSVY